MNDALMSGRGKSPRFRNLSCASLALAAVLAAGCQTGPAALSPTVLPAPGPVTQTEQRALTPAAARQRLEEGNVRYVAGRSHRHDWAKERAATAAAQHPFAAVLGCIDSRAPAEVIFDQGLGDLFHARVAGNILDDDLLGSLEFACQVAGARLIAVVGHTRCGAVKGACSGAQLGHLTGLLARIQPSVAEVQAAMPGVPPTDPRFQEEVARRNVQRVTMEIRERSPVLRKLLDDGQVGLVGGIYDLETGRVEFLNH